MNFFDQTAILTGFTYVQGDIGSRLFVRVEPKNSAPVEFSIKGSQLKGQLVDISLEGAGIHTAAGFFGPNYFTVNTPLQLVLQLPSTGSPVKLTGVIVNQRKTSNSYRLGIKTAPDSQARQVVSQYIAQRQAAVLRELHMLYDMFEKLEGK